MSHTKGPWKVGNAYGAIVSDTCPSDGFMGAADTEAYGGYLIAESVASSDRPLIAAAPELLEALKEAKEFIENQQLPDTEWSRILDLSVAAIAKAAGGAL